MTTLTAAPLLLVCLIGLLGSIDGAYIRNSNSNSNTLQLRPLHVSDRTIRDDENRTVLLRGVNLNALGDYYQANPEEPTVISASESDFERMASLGFNVVRLIVSWSKLEPQRGVISEEYIEEIKSYVQYAKQHGIYTVLDMHQDAWGKYIATNSSEEHCFILQPAIGWDGAPKWATLTDGKSTCRVPGVRELSPAVAHAFENFYRNRHGIQDNLVNAWARLAAEFAAEPAVAGYDLLNEPHVGLTIGYTQTILLGKFYTKAINAIRKAERHAGIANAGAFQHICLFQCTVGWEAFTVTLWPIGPFMYQNNIVFAPHLYGGSITVFGTIGEGYKVAQEVADFYKAPFWGGEWGWFGAKDEPKVWEFAQYQDQYQIGGTAWQWKQACGDPHSQRDWGGRTVTDTQYQVNLIECPNGTEGGINPVYETVLTRAFPRLAPGEISEFSSDPYHGYFMLKGSSTSKQGTLELWIPHSNRVDQPIIHSAPWKIDIERTEGGYYLWIDVKGDYMLEIDY